MIRRILIRVALGVVTLFAVSAIVFLGAEALPGDAAEAELGQAATPALLKQLRHEFGLDRPIVERYVEWLSGLPRGDFGRSLPSGQPVSEILSDKVRNTFALAFGTFIILAPISIFLGVVSAARKDGLFDHSVATATIALIAMPEFVIGTLLALAAIRLEWLPPVSLVNSQESIFAQLDLLALPILTLLAAAVAQTVRMVRATMIDVLRSDYVEMAVLKGASPSRVMFWHALPNALAPTIQILAFTTGWLIGGIVVVEAVFEYPGLGLAFRNAVSARDLPTVETITLLITGVYIVVNIAADVAVIILNPRLRRAR